MLWAIVNHSTSLITLQPVHGPPPRIVVRIAISCATFTVGKPAASLTAPLPLSFVSYFPTQKSFVPSRLLPGTGMSPAGQVISDSGTKAIRKPTALLTVDGVSLKFSVLTPALAPLLQ